MVDQNFRNLDTIFQETINQYNYSSNLFDSLESKTNTLLVSISIIFVISLNSYFLTKIENSLLIISVMYYIGMTLILISFIILLNLRKHKFKVIKIDDIKKSYIEEPNKNFQKIIINKYIPIIDENLNRYDLKNSNLMIASLFMKFGLIFIFVTFVSFILF